MQGLINRSFQCFIRDIFGQDTWLKVVARSGVGIIEFEALQEYDDAIFSVLLTTASKTVGLGMAELAEDLGAYLVTHESCASVRRLLRFGGGNFCEFLSSLPELQSRAALALDELDLPDLSLDHLAEDKARISVSGGPDWSVEILTGLVRAMADDYGVLAVLSRSRLGERGRVEVTLYDVRHSKGRDFSLASESLQ